MAAAGAGDSGEVCVPSASLDPPEPRETPPPTQPPTTVEPTTPPPTQPPTQTRALLCPLQGWDRFRLANDHAVNATPDLTVTLSPEACMVECLNRRCKGFSLPSGNPNDPRPCYLYTTTTSAIPRYESMNLTPEQGMATYVRNRQCMPACDTSSSASELFTMLPGVRPKSASAFFKIRDEDSAPTDTAELCGERCLNTYKCKSFTWLFDTEASAFGRCQM